MAGYQRPCGNGQSTQRGVGRRGRGRRFRVERRIRHRDHLSAQAGVGARFDRIVATHNKCRPMPSFFRRRARLAAVGASPAGPVRENLTGFHLHPPRHRVPSLLPTPERDSTRRSSSLLTKQVNQLWNWERLIRAAAFTPGGSVSCAATLVPKPDVFVGGRGSYP